ncbi:matrix metalloproteinase-17-like [Arapaima gigas]
MSVVPKTASNGLFLCLPAGDRQTNRQVHPPQSFTLSLGLPQDWLSRFGYLPPPDAVTGQLQTQEALTSAIKAMQRFGGLEETGVLDQATLSLMMTPRCSLPDLSVPKDSAGRGRRSLAPPSRWNKQHLSWRVRTFPRDSQRLLGRDTVRALMFYALKVWSDIAPLDFHEVAGNTEADIHVDFTKADHDDGYPFDGPGGTVAHAFFPGDRFSAGDTHFDDDEAWTFRAPDHQGMDLFAVAVHEFGHAIGLAHTSTAESVMRPYYRGPVGDPLKYELPYEDKVRVWQLYGDVVLDQLAARPSPCSRPTADAPDRCTTAFDAIAHIRGEAFFFKGKYFWRLTRDGHLVSLRPAQIQRFWRGLPLGLDSVDAVYERPGDHRIVFFKGAQYWVFKDNHVEEGYPRPISDLGLPAGGVDAAFVWPHNDKTYLFKGALYWRYDDHLHHMDPGYPKESTLWKGVPTQLDDAMQWSNGSSYFFKGAEYWQVTGSSMEAEPGYPRPIGQDWLLCMDVQLDSPPAEATEARNHGDRAKSGFEVCSCTSSSAAADWDHPPDMLLRLLTSAGVTAAALWLWGGAPL